MDKFLYQVKSGIIGHCTADALGVPVEFMEREEIDRDPVTDMRGYGTYNLPAGSWSDDTSMTLCLLDSLADGLDYNDIMEKFLLWLDDAEYTPHGSVFDVGRTCMKAIYRFSEGIDPLSCGLDADHDNGNGSLMRILPIAFYLHTWYGKNLTDNDESYDIIHNVSALTHAHPRSKIACDIYITIAEKLMNGSPLREGINEGIDESRYFYSGDPDFADELNHYKRIFDDSFADLPREEIKSSGYVVDSLEAALWCLLNTENYKDCTLKAVNLGRDTDTVAAIAGGLAGIFYGLEEIPTEWIDQIARYDYINNLCEKFVGI